MLPTHSVNIFFPKCLVSSNSLALAWKLAMLRLKLDLLSSTIWFYFMHVGFAILTCNWLFNLYVEIVVVCTTRRWRWALPEWSFSWRLIQGVICFGFHVTVWNVFLRMIPLILLYVRTITLLFFGSVWCSLISFLSTPSSCIDDLLCVFSYLKLDAFTCWSATSVGVKEFIDMFWIWHSLLYYFFSVSVQLR